MRGRRWLVLVVVAASISTGVAVATSGSSETSPVNGDFQADLVKQKQRPCDATNTRFQARFVGTQTSSDARLEGDFEAKAESVVSNDNGWGRTEGTVTIRKTGRRSVKFRGEFVGVIEPDGGVEGFLTGDTTDRRSVHLLANFNVDQDPATGAITGEFGKDSQTDKPYAPHEDQDPAILTNACFDRHHHGGGHH